MIVVLNIDTKSIKTDIYTANHIQIIKANIDISNANAAISTNVKQLY